MRKEAHVADSWDGKPYQLSPVLSGSLQILVACKSY